MAQFDQAAHYLIRRAPPPLFRWLLPRLSTSWRFRGFAETNTVAFPGEPDRVCDTVAEFVRAGRPGRRLLVDVEAQAQPHPDMLERLGEYAYRLRRELRFGRGDKGKYGVLSVLLNLTGPAQPDELDMAVEEADGVGARLKVKLFTPRSLDATETLARVDGGELERPVLPWVALMHGAGKASIIREWKRLAAREPDDRWRSDLGALALIFSDLAGREPIWEAELKGWNMKQSQVILGWQREAKIEATREKLMELLQGKFGEALPGDLRDAINASNDLDVLNRWFTAAVRADSLSAFRAAMNR